MSTRLLALVNIALIPYVALRFPREAPSYVRECFQVLIHGPDTECPYGDPTCPCPDGDACHYVADADTPAMHPPTGAQA